MIGLLGLLVLVSARGDRFGYALAPYVDVDGDGVREVVVTDPTLGSGRAIAVWILSGATGKPLRSYEAPMRMLGTSVAVIADLDADGLPELAVGSRTGRGPAEIVSPGTGTSLASYPEGGAIIGVRDRDGDGRADFLVGAAVVSAQTLAPIPDAFPPSADSVLVAGSDLVLERGGDGTWRLSASGAVFPGWLRGASAIALSRGERASALVVVMRAPLRGARELFALDPTRGEVVWHGEARGTGTSSGTFLVPVGDVDADGHGDLAVSEYSPLDERLGLRSGTTGATLGTVRPLHLHGDIQERRLVACELDDVDGDGHADFVVGENREGGSGRGCVRLVSGQNLEPLWFVERPEDF